MSPMSPDSHFIWISYTSSRSMHYVSPLSPGSHQVSTPFTFSYFGRSRSTVSHRSHYMNHAKIYPFSDVSCPQWALGATSYQCHIHIGSAAWVSRLQVGSLCAVTIKYHLLLSQRPFKAQGLDIKSIAGPNLWNQLPSHIRLSKSIDVYKRSLKTHLFKDAFNL